VSWNKFIHTNLNFSKKCKAVVPLRQARSSLHDFKKND
jgi:hypothetical protein